MKNSLFRLLFYARARCILLSVVAISNAYGQQPYVNNSGNRPIEVLAIGDSVVWGQGLKDANKFSVLVKTWLESRVAGRIVNLHYADAHSGATILPELPLMNRRRY